MTTSATRAAGVLGLAAIAVAGASAFPTAISAQATPRYAPYELTFHGPSASESDVDPNPFLDYRLQVLFTAPSGKTYDVPGFFDGDAAGSGQGTAWKARFSPDQVGTWTWKASFRAGDDVAVSLDPWAGKPTHFDGVQGSFLVQPEPKDAPGFLKKGRLRYVGAHHLRFQDGSWFLKTGTNSPENLFGYSGFDGAEDQGGLPQSLLHHYDAHVQDWKSGDPAAGAAGSKNGLKGLVGALNYLASSGVNAVYFLPMNLGGDGQDTWPFLSAQKTGWAKTHYDTSRLAQWNTVLEHATRRGILVQIVLAETEPENEAWLDDGDVGVERKLFFRELVARFAHNLALKWNLGEENDFNVIKLGWMVDYLAAVDPYDHPICVHTYVDDFSDYEAILGDPGYSATSIQYSNDLAGAWTEQWRAKSEKAGRKWVVDLDENGTAQDGVTNWNVDDMRKRVLYDVLFSGGGIEWYLGSHTLPLGGDQSLEDFRTRDDLWRYSRYARELLESEFPFWKMVPADHLLTGESSAYGGGEVFRYQHRDFAIYLPDASAPATLDLSMTPASAKFLLRWFDPRNGQIAGGPKPLSGGGKVSLGSPPGAPDEDWVAIVQRIELLADHEAISVSKPTKQTLLLDGGSEHAFETYLVLSSESGTSPGTDLMGVHVPLNLDAWMLWSLTNPQSAITQGFVGYLDENGRATASVNVGAFAGPAFVGTVAHHAFVAGPGGKPSWASNPVKLTFAP